MRSMSVGSRVGAIIAVLHLGAVLLAMWSISDSTSSTASLVFLPFFILDAPLHLLLALLPRSFVTSGNVSPFILYGLLGSSMWFAIPWGAGRLLIRFWPNASVRARWSVCIGVAPVAIAVFVPLGIGAVGLSIKQERPAELKRLLGKATTDYVSRRTVFEDDSLPSISSIHLLQCTGDSGHEIFLSTHRQGVFLDMDYNENERITFADEYFHAVLPVPSDTADGCQFFAYRLFKNASLLNSQGQVMWNSEHPHGESSGTDGIATGDMNGDGLPELALWHRYKHGILLLDRTGQKLWHRTGESITHVEFADLQGDGTDELVYVGYGGSSAGRILRAVALDGTITDSLVSPPPSSEFEVVQWPEDTGAPCILFSEEDTFRLIRANGMIAAILDAPGTAHFGQVAAAPVALRVESKNHLAVRNDLHPDVSALYVYDPDGNLVYLETWVRQGAMETAIETVPDTSTGAEKLLVGGIARHGAVLWEYVHRPEAIQ